MKRRSSKNLRISRRREEKRRNERIYEFLLEGKRRKNISRFDSLPNEKKTNLFGGIFRMVIFFAKNSSPNEYRNGIS